MRMIPFLLESICIWCIPKILKTKNQNRKRVKERKEERKRRKEEREKREKRKKGKKRRIMEYRVTWNSQLYFYGVLQGHASPLASRDSTHFLSRIVSSFQRRKKFPFIITFTKEKSEISKNTYFTKKKKWFVLVKCEIIEQLFRQRNPRKKWI